MGSPGFPAETPLVKPTARGYQYHLEAHLDEMNEIIHIIADNLQKLGLPLSTIEDDGKELEFTFSPMSGLEAADAMLLLERLSNKFVNVMVILLRSCAVLDYLGFSLQAGICTNPLSVWKQEKIC